MNDPVVIDTADGSRTLRHGVSGELYHSDRGAKGESAHVFIRAGFDAFQGDCVRVFEVGFGTGLNALLTLRRARESDRQVEYHAVELYPLSPEVVRRLGYEPAGSEFDSLFAAMHDCPWDVPVRIDDGFSLKKIYGSLSGIELDTIFDVIYFDAFAPDTQPELWSEAVFCRLYGVTAPGGSLVTYSAKGTVKRALRAAGYEVVRLSGALGKRHMLRATRPPIDSQTFFGEEFSNPLGEDGST